MYQNREDSIQASRTVRIALLSDTHSTRATTGDQPLYRSRFERVLEDVLSVGVDLPCSPEI